MAGSSGNQSPSWNDLGNHQGSPYQHWLSFGWQGCIMNNKTPLTPITWETTRVLGSFCQEPERKKKYIFLVVVLVAQSCQSLCDSMDYRPPGSSVHGILQARILEWVAIPFSRGSSQPRDWTQVSCIVSRFFTVWATREVHMFIISWYHKYWSHRISYNSSILWNIK